MATFTTRGLPTEADQRSLVDSSGWLNDYRSNFLLLFLTGYFIIEICWSIWTIMKQCNLFFLFVFCFRYRGSPPSRRASPCSLPCRNLEVFHHHYRLRHDAYEPDHVPGLPVRQDQAAHHRAQPRFRRPAHGIRAGLEQSGRPHRRLPPPRLAGDLR